MPTFAFPKTPPNLTVQLQRHWNAPLPSRLHGAHSFGSMLNARVSSTPNRSTSELLRTL
jgi:hypothetical protein